MSLFPLAFRYSFCAAAILGIVFTTACTRLSTNAKSTKSTLTNKDPAVNIVYDKICYYSGIELMNFAEVYKINPDINKAFFKVYVNKLQSNPTILHIYRLAYRELQTGNDVNSQEFAIKYYLMCTNLKNFYTHNRISQCFRMTNIQRLSYIGKLYGRSKRQVIREYLRHSGPLNNQEYRGVYSMINTVYNTRNSKDAYNIMYTTFKDCRDKTELLLSVN